MIMITPINRHTGELKKPIEKDITQFTFWLERAIKRGYEPFEIDGTLLLRAVTMTVGEQCRDCTIHS